MGGSAHSKAQDHPQLACRHARPMARNRSALVMLSSPLAETLCQNIGCHLTIHGGPSSGTPTGRRPSGDKSKAGGKVGSLATNSSENFPVSPKFRQAPALYEGGIFPGLFSMELPTQQGPFAPLRPKKSSFMHKGRDMLPSGGILSV